MSSKLSVGFSIEPLHDGNDKATDKLFSSFFSIGNDNGKAAARFVSAITVYAKMSLHVLGSKCTCYFTVWRNNIKN